MYQKICSSRLSSEKAILSRFLENISRIWSVWILFARLGLRLGAFNPEGRLKSNDFKALAQVKRCKWLDLFEKVEVAEEVPDLSTSIGINHEKRVRSVST
jgi:hypothetical protein